MGKSRVEAVFLGNFGDVFWFGKGNICAIIESCTVLGSFDHLNGSIIAHFGLKPSRQRYLRQAKGTIVLDIRRAGNGEHGQHGVAEVERLVAITHVDVELSESMARKPSWLYSDGATLQRPICAVSRCRHAATRVHPLHSVGKPIGAVFPIYTEAARLDTVIVFGDGAVGMDVVPSPARIYNDSVGGGNREEGDETQELSETKHVATAAMRDVSDRAGDRRQVRFSTFKSGNQGRATDADAS